MAHVLLLLLEPQPLMRVSLGVKMKTLGGGAGGRAWRLVPLVRAAKGLAMAG